MDLKIGKCGQVGMYGIGSAGPSWKGESIIRLGKDFGRRTRDRDAEDFLDHPPSNRAMAWFGQQWAAQIRSIEGRWLHSIRMCQSERCGCSQNVCATCNRHMGMPPLLPGVCLGDASTARVGDAWVIIS